MRAATPRGSIGFVRNLTGAFDGVQATMFIRFVVAERDQDSDCEAGVYTALYALERRGELAPYELEWFRDADRWLTKHLKRPTRFAWASRPNAPNRAISWLN